MDIKIEKEKEEVSIPVGHVQLKANLTIPDGAMALVVFSHGSGSSRFSRRNNYVARLLNDEKIATLLADLLTEEEDEIYENRFDIDLMTQRLVDVTKYVMHLSELQHLKVGYFGASTGAASALKAAAILGEVIEAVVSRGGRPDLAEEILPSVKAPTLLIVGSHDYGVLELNQKAYNMLRCEKQLEIVQGATHLFEEPGKLDEVSKLACKWFEDHLIPIHTIIR